MTTASSLEDRLAIRELIDRWSDAVNEHDWASLGTCFIDDGVWDVGAPYSFRFEGNKTIMERVPPLIEAQQYVIQMPHAVVIKLDGDTATARATMHEIMRGADGSGMQMFGTYYDDLVRTPAGWRFKQRTFRVAIFEPTAPSGELYRTFPAAL